MSNMIRKFQKAPAKAQKLDTRKMIRKLQKQAVRRPPAFAPTDTASTPVVTADPADPATTAGIDSTMMGKPIYEIETAGQSDTKGGETFKVEP